METGTKSEKMNRLRSALSMVTRGDAKRQGEVETNRFKNIMASLKYRKRITEGDKALQETLDADKRIIKVKRHTPGRPEKMSISDRIKSKKFEIGIACVSITLVVTLGNAAFLLGLAGPILGLIGDLRSD